VHTAAAASKARAGSGRGSFAAKFAKIHEKVLVLARCAALFRDANSYVCKELCEDEARHCEVDEGSEGSQGEQSVRFHRAPPPSSSKRPRHSMVCSRQASLPSSRSCPKQTLSPCTSTRSSPSFQPPFPRSRWVLRSALCCHSNCCLCS
jgi:hypothetical protein